MKKRKVFFFLPLIAVLCSLVFVLSIRKKTGMVKNEILRNGLKVLVKENPSNEIVAVEIFFGGGSAAESLDKAGLTYLTTRLIFKGTKDKDFTRIAQGFDSLGGVYGLSVERDFTEVHLVISKKYWKKGLKLLAEVLTEPVFPEEEIEKEKKLIISQIENIEDNPFEFTNKVFNENIYGTHPYAKPTFGYPNTIEQFDRDEIIKQYQRCFCAKNTVITLVGNLNLEDTIKLVKEYFGNLPSGKRLNVQEQSFQKLASRKFIKKPDLMQSVIFLGFEAAPVNSQDYAALKLINSLMGGGMSSRLFENIRDKNGIGYSLGSFYPTRLATSTFVFFLGVQPERVEESVTAFWNEIKKLQYEKISDEEFKKAKNHLIGNFYLSKQRNREQAYFIGWFETLGLENDFDKVYLKNVEDLEISQVKEVSNRYFKPENSCLLILTPEDMN